MSFNTLHTTMRTVRPTLHVLAAAACLALGCTSAHAQTAPAEAELMRRLDRLSNELDQVKAQLAEMKRQQASARPAGAAAEAAVNTGTPALAANGAEGAGAAATVGAPATVISGYAELNYNHYTRDSSRDQADMRRFVLGYQHRFDDRTKVVTELEVEHAVTSADDADPGEVEVEQAYMERQLSAQWALRAGLFLMPVGLINENHEPTAFYGVERNFVETAIIPSTWREGGVQFVGALDNGWTLQAGLTTSFDLSKWAADDAETADSPLGSVHQELAQAHSKDLAVFGAANWRGVPGLLLGASLFTGGAGQGQAASGGGHLRVTLWDVHARYTPGAWDLSALYTQGQISGTAAFNQLSLSSGPDWYPVPKRFDGGYVQAAYKLWSSGDLSLAPFARLERFNTRAAFADLGQGLTQLAAPTEQVVTFGANLAFGQGLVVKADVQHFKEDKDKDRVNLGLGWSF